MSTSTGHLTKLVQLAKEPSSDKRRELLRDITDLFIDQPDARLGAARESADHILTDLAEEMEESVRTELAERFADAPEAPEGLIRRLALDAVAVARPLLERSDALTDDILVEVAERRGQDHLRAIANRSEVSERVADTLVDRGDVGTLAALTLNEGAQLSRGAMEQLVDKAEDARELHEPLVSRRELPPDLLNEMFFFVGERLREKIAERTAALDPDELEAAVKAAQDRLSRRARALPSDYEDAMRLVQSKKLRKQLDGALLVSFLKDRKFTHFNLAFADLTGLDYTAARRIAESPAVDALAIACRSAGFDQELFVTLALLRDTKDKREASDMAVLGEIYDTLPLDAARRAVRFWRVRRDQQDAETGENSVDGAAA